MRAIAIIFVISFCSGEVLCQTDTSRLSILFIGDIMQHESQFTAAYDPIGGKYDYAQCFQFVKPLFESVDVAIGNLELTLGGTPYSGYPAFSAPDELAGELKDAGIDILVTANNHCLDRGKAGLERTIAVLDTLGLTHTGTFTDSASRARTYPLHFVRNGIRLSLLNYTYGTNGIKVTPPSVVNYIDTVQIGIDLAKTNAQNPDAIIVFLHWGDEYQRQPNKSQKMVAEFCFRHGAKLVIGAHPHVIQPMEWHKDADQLVVYSLGNFVSAQRTRFRDGGAMLYVELEKLAFDSTTRTHIGLASYELQYVHYTPSKKFIVLPVKSFEEDTVVLAEESARLRIKQFAADSRELLNKYNRDIAELTEPFGPFHYFVAIPIDSMHHYNIDSLLANDRHLRFYGALRDSSDGHRFLLGAFPDPSIAETVRMQVLAALPYKRAYVIRRRKDD